MCVRMCVGLCKGGNSNYLFVDRKKGGENRFGKIRKLLSVKKANLSRVCL